MQQQGVLVILSIMILFSFMAAGQADLNADEVHFLDQVKPLLDRKCLPCHGGDEKKIRSNFDIRTREGVLAGGDWEVPALIPGEPEKSPLYRSVTWSDPDLQMPPKENDRLTPEEQMVLYQWIGAGAPWAERAAAVPVAAQAPEVQWDAGNNEEGVPIAGLGGLSDDWNSRKYLPEDLWAFMPLSKPEVPSRTGIEENEVNPVDRFIDAKLAAAGLRPAGRADKRTLLKRVTYGLTGLPPALEETAAFLADDSPDAFDKVIERLLASPRYGEQWARHWLDVVRYADTSGYSNDFERPNSWRYRDYVIRSFNADKPYDRFILEQIAGDELEPDNPEMLIATGYLRMGPWEHTAMSVEAVTRQLFLDDVTNNVGETFLAQGLRCASCHDHKFDPISTEDYYRMQANFAPAQLADREAGFLPGENLEGFDAGRERLERLLAETRAEIAHYRDIENKATRAWLDEHGMKDVTLMQARKLPEDEGPPRFLGLTYTDLGVQKVLNKREQSLQQELKRYEPLAFSIYNGPVRVLNITNVDQSMPPDPQGPVQAVHVLLGGSVEAPAQEVAPGVLRAIAAMDPAAAAKIPEARDGRRLALARWIASPENPLTARVMVNRVWQYHFGKGLSGTPNNFGKMGKKPSHPELLDWLASYFVEHGWSVKELHRLILRSEAYQRAADYPEPEALAKADPGNALLACYPPRRLSAEELRDSMLQISGELYLDMGGVPVWPEINQEAALQPRHIMGSVAPAYQPSPTPEQRNRRTIYTMHIRTLRNPMLEVFNQPDSSISCERREASTVTPQVFALFNSVNSQSRAIALAARIADETEDTKARAAMALHRVFGREPAAEEVELASAHIARMTALHQGAPAPKRNLPSHVEREMVEEMTGVEFQWTEELDLYEDYTPDLAPCDVAPPIRALADLCLVLFNSNEFAYIY